MCFGGPKGAVRCPNKGNKTIRQKEKQKQKDDLQGKKTAKREGGTSIRSQPVNFARKLNSASRLVKILLKDYIQYKRQYTKDKKEKHSSKANPEPTKTAVQPTKVIEGEQRDGRRTH